MTKDEERATEGPYELPAGWAWAKIGDLIGPNGIFIDGDWVESKDQDPSGDVRLIQLADVGDGHYRNRSQRYLTSERANELGCTFLIPGDVLIARMPDPLGRACIFPGDPKRSVTVVDVCIVRTGSEGSDHHWLMHAINAPAFRASIESLQSGSTRKRISRGNLAKLDLPVPPLAEQRRIAAKVDELLTSLDAGMAGLKRIQAALKRYRAAVLKAACEGRLVPQDPNDEPAETLLERILAERREKWEADLRAKGKDPKKAKYEEPKALHTEGLPELPEGWCWATVEHVSRMIQYGTSEKASESNIGVVVLRMGNIRDGELDFANLKFLPESISNLSELILQPGDVLFNRTNSAELVGKTAVYRQYHPRATFASYLIRVKLSDCYSPDFLAACINSLHGRRYIASVVSQQVGQANVNGTKLAHMPVPMPPFAEQCRIVLEVDRRLSVTREMEKSVEANLVRSERLRQAILRRAFEGKLGVPESERIDQIS